MQDRNLIRVHSAARLLGVSSRMVRYFIASDRGGPPHGRSGPAQQITTWVQQNFTPIDVDGTTVYDLSQPR